MTAASTQRGSAFFAILLLAAILLPLAFSRAQAAPSPTDQPSVLLITIDTLRADHVGCYGYRQVETPAINQLASDGIRFENAYAQVPITLPSHAVILTGTYPMFNGVHDFTSPGLPGDVPTLAEILRRNGFRTAAFVSSFVLNSMWGLNRGFEVYDDNVGLQPNKTGSLFQLERRGDLTADRMLAWLRHRDGKPFFVWLHLYDPHSPYRAPEPYRSRYSTHPYDGEIAFADAQVGRVLTRLRELGLYENTAVILLSDHGESLGEHGEGEHGFFIYDATLRVPLILKLPGEAQKGRIPSQPVGTIDVAPTVAWLCGIPASETRSFQGRSLLQVVGERPTAAGESVYAESYYPRDSFGWHELCGLVTRQFKYIDAPQPELYDLMRDPGERSNLAAANSALRAFLRGELESFQKRFTGTQEHAAAARLDPETIEKLKSLGYLSYEAPHAAGTAEPNRADPKDKIGTLNRILRAADLTRLGEYSAADALLSSLEQAETGLYVVPFQRGENFLAWGKAREALGEFRQALGLNPRFDQAALGLGRTFFLLGQDEQAATALGLALRLNPRNFLARAALAKVYWRENQLAKAEAELVQVIRSHPEFAEAHGDYGIILARQGRYREALPEIQRGIQSGYRDAIAYNYLGITYAGLGDSAKAMEAYEQAVKINPRYAAAHLNLALQFRKQGQLVKAQGYYHRVCELSQELCRQFASKFSSPE